MPANRGLLERVARHLFPDARELAHLATGGYASTFRISADEQVLALKIIDPALSVPERVERELAALQRVSHPNVVAYRDFGAAEFEAVTYHWVTMDFVAGQPLAQAMREGRRFSVSEAVHLLSDAVAGAAAIWEAGTSHRDLSPNNLLITDAGRIVIVDLGLARHVDDETITALPTPGTPGWMSPEQVGANPSHGDWRSDQFVLGLVGYLMLTGAAPFRFRNLAEAWLAPVNQTVRGPRQVNSSVPSVVSEVVERMTAAGPHRRYLQPAVLIADLARAAAALTIEVTTTVAPCTFGLLVGQIKNFCTDQFLKELAPDELIVDARARARTSEFVGAGQSAGAACGVDPVTHFARSTVTAQPAQFRQLPYGGSGLLTGFPGHADRRFWCQQVLAQQLAEDPEVVIAPYFYAGPSELPWIHESLSCAAVTSDLLRELVAAGIVQKVPALWTAVAVDASWLRSLRDRDSLLTALTGQAIDALYLLASTIQPSFGAISDSDVLSGFADLLGVMRDARVPVIVGRRASCGLLLLALGAAGWTTGIHANLQNMTSHPQDDESGGPGYSRVYVPKLLSSITTEALSIFAQARGDLLELGTRPGAELIRQNPEMDVLTTDQRILMHQHNMLAMRTQAAELSSLPLANRLGQMSEWVAGAQDLFGQLPPPRLPGDGGAFLEAWRRVL